MIGMIILLLFPRMGWTASYQPFMVVTNNMGTINGNVPDIENIDFFLTGKGRPDVVFLQEVPSIDIAQEIAAKLSLPYISFLPYKDWGSYGVAILSRYHVSDAKILRQNDYASLSTIMDYNGTPILLCSVHLKRIKPLPVKDENAVVSWSEFGQILYSEVFADNQRSRDVDNLLAWLAAEDVETVIVGGDFNTFPLSKAVRKMTDVYDDCFWPTWDYLTTSYPKVDFPIKPRIDHIFHSPNLKCLDAGVIEETVGDHYPVWGEIEVR